MVTRIETEIEIDAEPAAVWQVLADVDRWSEWNPVLRGLSGPMRVGAWHVLRLNVAGPVPVLIPVRLTELEPGRALAWRGGVRGIVRAEHGFRVEPAGDGRTRVLHHETFSGVVTRVLGSRIEATLDPRYRETNEALRTRAEHARP